jgi:hypothetical protein
MDNLSLQFAEETALRQIDECNDIEQLKTVTRSLIQGHFQARAFMCTLLKQNLPRSDSFRNT